MQRDAQWNAARTPADYNCSGCLEFAGTCLRARDEALEQLAGWKRLAWLFAAAAVLFAVLLMAGGWRGLLRGGFAELGAQAAATWSVVAASAGAAVRPEDEVGRAEAEGTEAARKGWPCAANPYAFNSQAWAKKPEDAKGRPYRAELDEAWDSGWRMVEGAAAATVVQARTWAKGSARGAGPAKSAGAVRVRTAAPAAYKRGCSAGHNATWMETCESCGETECQGPCHPRHACGGGAA